MRFVKAAVARVVSLRRMIGVIALAVIACPVGANSWGNDRSGAWVFGISTITAATPWVTEGQRDTADPARTEHVYAPRLEGRVTDLAQMFTDAERSRITSMLTAYESETSHQLVVLTVPTLSGESIDAFSLRTINAWALGRKGVNNGILVTLAKQERKVRIELGGFEAYISNAKAKEIIKELMTPEFRKGRFAEGVEAGLRVLMDEGRRFAVSPETPPTGTSDLARTVAALVKAQENALPPLPVVAAERAVLAREVLAASRSAEVLAGGPSADAWERLDSSARSANISVSMRNVLKEVAQASFRAEPVLELMTHRLAEGLDMDTLRGGLAWERSDLRQRIRALEIESAKPEQQAALRAFAEPLIVRGRLPEGERTRACGQVDILTGQTDALLPVIEIMMVGSAVIVALEKSQPQDQDAVARMLLGVRPMILGLMQQSVLIGCLFSFRELTDGEFEQWLSFLRSDSGGRYERGKSAALVVAMRQRADIFIRTLLQIAPQVAKRPHA